MIESPSVNKAMPRILYDLLDKRGPLKINCTLPQAREIRSELEWLLDENAGFCVFSKYQDDNLVITTDGGHEIVAGENVVQPDITIYNKS